MYKATGTVLLLTFFCLALGQYTGLEPPTCTGSNVLPNSVVQPGYCPKIWASQLGEPRALEVASNGDILTIESALGRMTVLWDANGDGVSSSSERAVLATVTGLNHAVRINGNYVYASNATNVFRWPYQAGDRSNLGPFEIVIKNIPCCHHVTRSLAFDKNNLLYVQVGSGSNVDPDTTHSRINQFDIYSQPIPSGGIDFNSGFVFVNGVRNEVGIRFDQNWNLWGVENGVDDLYRADLGGDIHNTNPSEELNYFGTPGLFYGYPYCWTAYNISGYPTGTQFYQSPEFTGVYNDTWCQDPSNVVVPALSMAAHMAPMDIIFWYTNTWPSINSGDAFVALHGSWNRSPPMGYRVDHVTFDASGFPVSNTPFLGYQGPGAYNFGWIRPVGLANKDNVLYVSSDQTGQIITISPN